MFESVLKKLFKIRSEQKKKNNNEIKIRKFLIKLGFGEKNFT